MSPTIENYIRFPPINGENETRINQLLLKFVRFLFKYSFLSFPDAMADSNDHNEPARKRVRRNSSSVQSSSLESIEDLHQINRSELVIKDEEEFFDAKDTTETAELVATEKFNKKIDGLDEKTLVQIFNWLEFGDLLNVANANEKLKAAAGKIYAEKYVDKVVKFDGDVANKKYLNFNETQTTIEISDARTCLKMFRAFGEFITSLSLNFNGIGPRRSDAISQTLNRYCAKTLIDLEWHHCPPNAMDTSSKKYPKLTNLRLTFGCLGETMSQFNEYFPALCKLELNEIEVKNRRCIGRTMPNVTHLKVHIESRRGIDFLKINVKEALRFNPQIRSFCVASNCDPTFLSFINEMLPLLETLDIQKPKKKFFESDANEVCFKQVKYFSLDIINSNDQMKNIPFKFNNLKKFSLNANCRFCGEWIDFIAQNKKLVEVELLPFNYFYVVSEDQLMKIAELPDLMTFKMDWRVEPLDVLLRFMAQCQSLETLRLYLRKEAERDDICARIGDDWDIVIDKHFVTAKYR